MRRRLPLIAALLLLLGGVAGFLLLRTPSEEERVRRVIQDIAAAAEEADLSGVIDHVDRGYRDEDGLDRDIIKLFLFDQFRKRGPLRVLIGPIAVTIEGEARASASFDAVLTEGSEASFWPKDADAQHFEVELVNREGDWLVLSQTHEPALALPAPPAASPVAP